MWEEYKIRYNYEKNKHVGQGKGNSKVGDVIGRDPIGAQQGPGKGQGEGDQPGEDYFEVEFRSWNLKKCFLMNKNCQIYSEKNKMKL